MDDYLYSKKHHSELKFENHTRFLYFRSTLNLFLVDIVIKKLLKPLVKKCIEFEVDCKDFISKIYARASEIKVNKHYS